MFVIYIRVYLILEIFILICRTVPIFLYFYIFNLAYIYTCPGFYIEEPKCENLVPCAFNSSQFYIVTFLFFKPESINVTTYAFTSFNLSYLYISALLNLRTSIREFTRLRLQLPVFSQNHIRAFLASYISSFSRYNFTQLRFCAAEKLYFIQTRLNFALCESKNLYFYISRLSTSVCLHLHVLFIYYLYGHFHTILVYTLTVFQIPINQENKLEIRQNQTSILLNNIAIPINKEKRM